MQQRWVTMAGLAAVLAAPLLATAADDPPTVFKAQCAKCHGETGQADTPSGKSLKVKPLAGNAKVAGMGIPEIVEAIKANEKHKTFAKKLTPEQFEAGAVRAKELAGAK